ncbi:MAG: sulfatase-like hydrolase/transferase, partial [Phycisphaerales bacterium JB063]
MKTRSALPLLLLWFTCATAALAFATPAVPSGQTPPSKPYLSDAKARTQPATSFNTNAIHADRPNILLIIADDWGWPHAGAYGDTAIHTPAFDRIASEGVLFNRAFVASPSCTPSRNAILTGQDIWRLGVGANLYGQLPAQLNVYPLLLQDAGYRIGHGGKSYGPGSLDNRDQHPAGPGFGPG